jgi:hypothetical protein
MILAGRKRCFFAKKQQKTCISSVRAGPPVSDPRGKSVVEGFCTFFQK